MFKRLVHLSGGSKPLLGDALVIGGTVFFAMSNVGEVCFTSCLDYHVGAVLFKYGLLCWDC